MRNKDQLTVSDDLVVSLDYTLRLEEDGQVVDTSAGDEPLEFIQGHGEIVPGLESALYGMSIGDEKEIVISPEEAYGNRDPDAVQEIPLGAFPSEFELTPGMQLQLRDQNGETVYAEVRELRPDSALLDFNHPLAGETLYFNVKVVDLRPATDEELEHDHVHFGPDGQHE